jgi:hypothetical protein
VVPWQERRKLNEPCPATAVPQPIKAQPIKILKSSQG